MTEREQQLRELITRVRKPDSSVSSEYNLLSVADAGYLLELLDQARGGTGYHEVARGIADLVVEKQAAYGDSFGKTGEVMRLLYPEGVKPEQLPDALTVVRVLDKLFRIATRRDAFGENPWRDVLGYALLAVERRVS